MCCLSVLQQYFFEFAFDEIKARPRHVCPYAVVSFHYKGKEAAVAPKTAHRWILFKQFRPSALQVCKICQHI